MRASRLLSTLILLQLRTRLTAEQIAQEFGVSIRTVYRDMEALSAAGVPILGDRGPGGGFQLLHGYRTKLTGLASDEAEAMLLIGLPEQAAAMGLGEATLRARNKLLAALPPSLGADPNRIAECFHLDTVDWYRVARPVPFLAMAARAVLDRRYLAMTYSSWTATRRWLVEPLGLVLKAGAWYLVATGHGKTRIFNLADAVTMDVREQTFVRPRDFELPSFWASSMTSFEARLRPHRAKVRASPLGLERLARLGAYAATAVAAATAPDQAGWRELDLPIESIEQAAVMLLGIGPEVTVVAPAELRKAVADLARSVLRRMQARSSGARAGRTR